MNKELTTIERLLVQHVISYHDCKNNGCIYKNECDKSIKENSMNLCYSVYEKMKK